MRKIRLIQIGKRVETDTSNVAVSLEQIQSEFIFELDFKTIMPKPLKKNDPGYHEEYLFKLIKSYMTKHDFREYPIAITNYSLYDELISISDDTGAIISTKPFKQYSKYSIHDCLLYTIASILPDINHQITAVHNETRGCPNDFCDNLADIDIGLKNGKYCPDCYDRLIEAVDKEIISVIEVASILKILDFLAKRKLCFVLMPFNKKFDGIYKSIKQTFTDLGYECYRADEVYEARKIIDMITEGIIRSKIIVADLTSKNPNVFYELGYAHSLGKSTILMSQNDSDVPFDLRQRQYFNYKVGSNQNLIIKNNIKKYIKK